MDGGVQPDGSIVATRIAVYDSAALNVMVGPLLFQSAYLPDFYSYGLEQQGQDYSVQPSTLGIYSFSSSTAFQVSGELSNLNSLPFVASFTGSNMVPGQKVAIFSKQLTAFRGGQTNAVTTMTLMPQTINGTVVGTSASANFAVYTATLASYDLFPALAVQQGQTTLLNNPSQIEIYVDSNTQKLNRQPLAAGNTLRFYGLVFNDNGMLRMDCAQVNDGVTGSSQSNVRRLDIGETRTVGKTSIGRVQETITTSH
jgi:hypothetical protein